MRYPHLMSPVQIGQLKLKNRVVMSPLTTNFAEEHTGLVTERLLEYYRERARGGVGLVIVEGAIVRADGRGFSKQLLVDRDETIQGLSRLARTVQENGSRAILQIMHHGRQTRAVSSGQQPVAPSSVPCPVFREIPKELSVKEINDLKACFVKAALRAQQAGFDGVEIHAAHGYLINQFLSPWCNHRTDDYGGAMENRSRFLLEIIKEIKRWTGDNFTVFCRISADEFVEGGLKADQIIEIGKLLKTVGVNGLDVSAGVAATFDKMSPPAGTREAPYTDFAEKVKREVGLPVITVARILTPDKAEQIVRDQKADLVALGRALVADPHWVDKAASGRERLLIPCIGCNVCTGRSSRPEVTCLTNPLTGREHKFRIQKTSFPKKVAIVGNGIGGYQAAILLKQRGHQVDLFAQSKLPFAGLTGLRSLVPLQKELQKFIRYFENLLEQFGLSIEKMDQFSSCNYDYVINTMVDVDERRKDVQPWHQKWISKVSQAKMDELYAMDVLLGRFPANNQVYVIGGSLLGCEIANILGSCYKVTVVEERKRVPYDVGNTIMKLIQKTLNHQGISIESPESVGKLDEPATVIWATKYPQIYSLTESKQYSGGKSICELGDSYQPDTMAELMEKAVEIAISI